MGLQAGFGRAKITPLPGTLKIGWLKVIQPSTVLDPLFSRAVVLEEDGGFVVIVSLDTLFVDATDVQQVRKEVMAELAIPSGRILIAATHNHGGPACCSVGDVPRDEAYCARMRRGILESIRQAFHGRQPVEVGFGRAPVFGIGRNRRVVLRDGTVRTHATFDDPDALFVEGPEDPELSVLAFQQPGGDLVGALVNFSCHPASHGGDDLFSAGYPGVLCSALEQQGVPASLFLNGAFGNISVNDPTRGGSELSQEEVGERLAGEVSCLTKSMQFNVGRSLRAASREISLPFRALTPDQINGTARGAQRFIDPAIYDRNIPALVKKIQQMGRQPAEVQALAIGDLILVCFPAEMFVEFGLAVKQKAWPRQAMVVGAANGIVGYVPTRAAFERGGYETTFLDTSKLAPEAGEILLAAASSLIDELRR